MIHIFEIVAIIAGVCLFLAGHVWREVEIHALRRRVKGMKESRDLWSSIAGNYAASLQARDSHGRFVKREAK